MGLKVTGPCNENFIMFLVPHIYIDVDTEDTNIELRTTLKETNNAISFESNSGSLEKKKYVKLPSNGTTGEQGSSTGTVRGDTESISDSSSSSVNPPANGAGSTPDAKKKNLQNICETGKNFKLVVYIKENTLILKWKVYGETKDTTESIKNNRIKQ